MGPHFFAGRKSLENLPNEVRQQREDRQHEYSADPDQEIHCHLGIVDLFFVHVLKLALALVPAIGAIR